MSLSHLAATVSLLALVSTTPAPAQPAAAPAATGFRADYVGSLGHVEEQMVSLEQAVPQAKFGWRPAKGVRSMAEVYLHAAGAAYFFAGQLGHEPPAEVKALRPKWESQTTDKGQIKTILTDAFAFLRKAALETSDADLEKKLQFFGTEFTQRGVLLTALGHFQEHLGQSIAYARFNGVVPPWSKKAGAEK